MLKYYDAPMKTHKKKMQDEKQNDRGPLSSPFLPSPFDIGAPGSLGDGDGGWMARGGVVLGRVGD